MAVFYPIVGIDPRQYERLKRRLAGEGRDASSSSSVPVNGDGGLSDESVVLGVDPSLRKTGFGVIRWAKGKAECLEQGEIACGKQWPHSRCLLAISQQLRETIRRYEPTVGVVEGLFFAQNLKTALIMGHARGAALLTMVEAGLEIFEMAPRKVKQAIVVYGGAQKLAVAKMVQRMLQMPSVPKSDAADALALALAFAHEQGRYRLAVPKKI